MKQNHVGHRNPLFLQIIPTSSHTTLKWKLIYLEASLSLKQCGSCTFWFVEDCITQSSGTKWWHCQLFLLSVIIFKEGLEIRSSQIWWWTVTTTQQSNISIWFNWGNKKNLQSSLLFLSAPAISLSSTFCSQVCTVLKMILKVKSKSIIHTGLHPSLIL